MKPRYRFSCAIIVALGMAVLPLVLDAEDGLSLEPIIIVSLDDKTLEFFEHGELVFKFPVRIGKPQTPTPTGEGFVYQKRDRPVFRYLDPGPDRGKVIRNAACRDGPRRIPRGQMRALGLNIRGMTQYSIHSTVCDETIGQEISNGCIGMRIDDMRALFSRVHEGTKIVIDHTKNPHVI